MAQAGYRSCSCHGWLYKEDGSEDAREQREHANRRAYEESEEVIFEIESVSQTDKQKLRRIRELMESTGHYALEGEALELAYSMVNQTLRSVALMDIADAMQKPELEDEDGKVGW